MGTGRARIFDGRMTAHGQSTTGTALWRYRLQLLSGQHPERSQAPPSRRLHPWRHRKNLLIAINVPEAKYLPRKSAKSPGLPASGRRCTMLEVKASFNHPPPHCWRSLAKHLKGFAALVSGKGSPVRHPQLPNRDCNKPLRRPFVPLKHRCTASNCRSNRARSLRDVCRREGPPRHLCIAG